MCEILRSILNIEDTAQNGENIGFVGDKFVIMDFKIMSFRQEMRAGYLDMAYYKEHPLILKLLKKDKELYRYLKEQKQLFKPIFDDKSIIKENIEQAYVFIKKLIISEFYFDEDIKQSNINKLRQSIDEFYIYFRSFPIMIEELILESELKEAQNEQK